MILCIGLAADDTFCYALSALKKHSVKFDVIDFAQFTYSGQISIPFNDLDSTILSMHDMHYALDSYKSAWVRLIDISSNAPDKKLQQKSFGLYQALGYLFSHSSLRVMNSPFAEKSNFTKLYHSISLASISGWCTPRTCLTSNKSRAVEFINSCDERVIFKGASGIKTWATIYESQKHLERLSSLSFCPVLFQELIEGPDVRVHVVGENIFAELIESTEVDYRISHTNKHTQIELPKDISLGCINLSKNIGIPFCGIDFKIQRSTGIWFFLEVNSMPCFQGYDKRTGGKISKALVDWLTQNA